MEKREDKLTDLSMQLSVDVLNLVKVLQEKKERIISNQIGRSATSICANIAESKYAHSRADFIDIQPDIVSILIGINDVWHHADDKS